MLSSHSFQSILIVDTHLDESTIFSDVRKFCILVVLCQFEELYHVIPAHPLHDLISFSSMKMFDFIDILVLVVHIGDAQLDSTSSGLTLTTH